MKDSTEKFHEALLCLSPDLKKTLLKIPDNIKSQVSEIRLNPGFPVMLVRSGETLFVGSDGKIGYINGGLFPKVTLQNVRDTLNVSCGYSLHSCQDSLKSGYLTVKGGHRVGIAARAVTENGNVKGIKDVSFLNIRIARESFGAADEIYRRFFVNEASNLIIAGPPSSGKTTVIRDLARQLSSIEKSKSYRVCIVDERDEIASMYNGQAQNTIGANSCVLSGYPKGQAVLTAVRALSPQIILCDEIGSNDEVCAVRQGIGCGVGFVLTMHAGSLNELLNKEQMKMLEGTGAFKNIVLLSGSENPCKIEEIYSFEKDIGT